MCGAFNFMVKQSMKMAALWSSEISGTIHSKDLNLQQHACENFNLASLSTPLLQSEQMI
jgi:hypothetical protein